MYEVCRVCIGLSFWERPLHPKVAQHRQRAGITNGFEPLRCETKVSQAAQAGVKLRHLCDLLLQKHLLELAAIPDSPAKATWVLPAPIRKWRHPRIKRAAAPNRPRTKPSEAIFENGGLYNASLIEGLEECHVSLERRAAKGSANLPSATNTCIFSRNLKLRAAAPLAFQSVHVLGWSP